MKKVENYQDSADSEPLKDQVNDKKLYISVENPKTKDVRTPRKPDKIDELTSQLVAINVFFLNKVFELKNEIARLKEASLIGK